MTDEQLLEWWSHQFGTLYASVGDAETKLRTGQVTAEQRRAHRRALGEQLHTLARAGRITRARVEYPSGAVGTVYAMVPP